MEIVLKIEQVDLDGGGIVEVKTLEELKDLINWASKKDGYEVLNIKVEVR